MPRGVWIFEKGIGIGGAGGFGRGGSLGSTWGRACGRRSFAEITRSCFRAVFEWGDRRAQTADDWDCVLHLRAFVWHGHLYAAQESSGASLDAGDLGADL